jgi:HEAT repeat protein
VSRDSGNYRWAKELAAKLNQILFGARLSDAQVDDLVARTSGKDVNFRDVYELGFGNNPRAIPQLVKLSANKDGYVMRAAMSSLGVLRADQYFDLLAKEAENTKDDFEDRATALKGIGDLGTPQSRAYLEKARARLDKLTDAEAVRTKGLIGLYLDLIRPVRADDQPATEGSRTRARRRRRRDGPRFSRRRN